MNQRKILKSFHHHLKGLILMYGLCGALTDWELVKVVWH
jgi:hypothetical protein